MWDVGRGEYQKSVMLTYFQDQVRISGAKTQTTATHTHTHGQRERDRRRERMRDRQAGRHRKTNRER